MLPIITSLVQTLAVNGLGLLAGAVQAKGKEFIESKIGARIPDNPNQEDLITLKELEIVQEQLLLQYTLKQKELEIEESKLLAEMHRASKENATQRWQSDMGSDSKLSKNKKRRTKLCENLSQLMRSVLLKLLQIENRNLQRTNLPSSAKKRRKQKKNYSHFFYPKISSRFLMAD